MPRRNSVCSRLPHDDQADAAADALRELVGTGGNTGMVEFYRRMAAQQASAVPATGYSFASALRRPITIGLSGATITHRPDVAYAEGALRKADAAGHGGFAGQRVSIEQEQAALQGHADMGGYQPARAAEKLVDHVPNPRHVATLAGAAAQSTHVIPGAVGTIQAPEPLHAAEPAKIGTETR